MKRSVPDGSPGHQEVRERPVVVARSLEDDANRQPEAMKAIGEETELGRGVGKDRKRAEFPF